MRKNGFLVVGSLLCFIFFTNPIDVGADEYVEPQKEVVEVIPTYDEVEIEIIEAPQVIEEKKYVIDVTDEEIDLMARVVMSEGSIISYEGQVAIAFTIVNRVRSDKFPNTVTEVVYQSGQYSTADNGEPTAEIYKAVYNALEYECFEPTLMYFRTDRYHDFGTPYFVSENTYFSLGE